jgi:hypothetical protein
VLWPISANAWMVHPSVEKMHRDVMNNAQALFALPPDESAYSLESSFKSKVALSNHVPNFTDLDFRPVIAKVSKLLKAPAVRTTHESSAKVSALHLEINWEIDLGKNFIRKVEAFPRLPKEVSYMPKLPEDYRLSNTASVIDALRERWGNIVERLKIDETAPTDAVTPTDSVEEPLRIFNQARNPAPTSNTAQNNLINIRLGNLDRELIKLRELITRQSDSNSRSLTTVVNNSVSNITTTAGADLSSDNAWSGSQSFVNSSTTLQNFTAQQATTTAATTTDLFVSNLLTVSSLSGSGTRCLQADDNGLVALALATCGSGGGSSGGSWSTTTSQVSGRLINYSNNATDIVTIGDTATTSAEVYFDPNALIAKVFNQFFGQSSTTLQNFTAASGTVTRLLSSEATSTNLFVSGLASTTNLRANSATFGSLTVTSCTGCGGSTFAWPFTKQADNSQATSTLLSLLGGLYTNASSTLASTTVTTLLSTHATSTNLFASINLRFDGEILPDGLTCSDGQILKKTGANDWDCAADETGAGGTPLPWAFTKLSTNEQATSTIMAFVGGFLSTGSTTINTLLSDSATTTNATSTNFYASGRASTTDLRANIATIGAATLGSLTVTSCTGCGGGGSFAWPFTTLGTGENATSTTLSFQNGFLAVASSTLSNFLFTSATGTAATTTSFAISGISSSLLKTSSLGSLVAAVANTDYQAPISATYPISFSSNVISLAFGTTTANLWSGAQTFLSASTTLQSFTFINATGTSATTTNLYVSSRASTTDLRANTANIGSLDIGDSAGTGDSVFQFSTDNEAWSLGFFSSDKTFRIASSTNLSANVFFQIGKSGTTTLNAGLGVESGSDDVLCIDPTTFEITLGGASCAASSLRYKEKIENLSYGLDTVMQMRPVSYEYIESERPGSDARYLGFIAEELFSILPEVIEFDALGLPGGIDYAKMAPVWAKAIQDINRNIESIASTSATTTPEAQTFAEGFFDNLFARMREWLANAANGITKFFAKEVHTEMLCVKRSDGFEICITGDQLSALLSNAALSGGIVTTSPPPEPSPVPESVPEPEPEVELEVEIEPEPEAESEPVSEPEPAQEFPPPVEPEPEIVATE